MFRPHATLVLATSVASIGAAPAVAMDNSPIESAMALPHAQDMRPADVGRYVLSGLGKGLSVRPAVAPFGRIASEWPPLVSSEIRIHAASIPDEPIRGRLDLRSGVRIRSNQFWLFGRAAGFRWRTSLSDCTFEEARSCMSWSVRPDGMPKLTGSVYVGLLYRF